MVSVLEGCFYLVAPGYSFNNITMQEWLADGFLEQVLCIGNRVLGLIGLVLYIIPGLEAVFHFGLYE